MLDLNSLVVLGNLAAFTSAFSSLLRYSTGLISGAFASRIRLPSRAQQKSTAKRYQSRQTRFFTISTPVRSGHAFSGETTQDRCRASDLSLPDRCGHGGWRKQSLTCFAQEMIN